MINTGGEKVSPVEVENVASGYEQAAECACVGVADPKGILGEIVVLFVVPKAGQFDEAGMTKFLSERLERFNCTGVCTSGRTSKKSYAKARPSRIKDNLAGKKRKSCRGTVT